MENVFIFSIGKKKRRKSRRPSEIKRKTIKIIIKLHANKLRK